jgi:AraC-like DNA-binding protein
VGLERSCAFGSNVGGGSYGAVVLTQETLIAADGVTVADVRCGGVGGRGVGAAWSDVEPVTSFGVVLTRSGLFRRQVDGVESVVDAAGGYVQRPGSEQRIAHPCGGDRCTSIAVSRAMVESMAGEGSLPGRSADVGFAVDPALDVQHRGLVARARQGAAAEELVERTVVLVGRLLTGTVPTAAASSSRGGRHRRVVDEVRQALHEDPSVGLSDLAGRVGWSPFHVSRVFRQAYGLTISHYRARLRVRRALERLGEGEHDLARLAFDVGFADQAHLTRTVRAETQATPGRLRTLLAGPGADVER